MQIINKLLNIFKKKYQPMKSVTVLPTTSSVANNIDIFKCTADNFNCFHKADDNICCSDVDLTCSKRVDIESIKEVE